jgi:tetratricopeptide (TPR) repeat protein
MKKIFLSTILAMLSAASMSHAAAERTEQGMAETAWQKKSDEAKTRLDKASKALSQDYEKYGMFHPKVAEDYKVISEAYFSMGKFDASIEYALHALKVEMKLRRENDPQLAKLYFDTGNMYYMHKQHPTALLYMEKASRIYKNGSDRESTTLADTYEGIASVYVNLEDNAKSLLYAQKCLDIRRKRLKKGDDALKRAQMNVDFLKKELKKEY